MEAILELADITETVEVDLNNDGKDPIVFHLGEFHGVPVVMFMSRVSMVPSAHVISVALENFDIEAVIFSGIAGGIHPDLHIGDVTVPAQWANHSRSQYSRLLGEDEWANPDDPDQSLPNYGMIYHQPTTIGGEATWWLPVDSDLLALAELAAEAVELEQCADAENCMTDQPIVVVGGSGVSGPVFVDNAEYREHVYEAFGGDVVALDMESWSAAYVAHEYGVPFLAIRSLSDLAGGGPGENEIGIFFGLASTNSARLVDALFALWGEQ
jgi:adenosylhomocysteine nucleosidase